MMEKEVSATNEMLKSALVGEYKSFVDSVEPSEIVDILIQERIMTTEEWNKLAAKETRQDKCRFLLDKIFTTTNPTSCIVLCDALREYYPWIHGNIKIKIETQEISSDNVDSGEVIEKLRVYEKENAFLFAQLKEQNTKIQDLEAEREATTKNNENYMNGDIKNIHKSCEENVQKLQEMVDSLETQLKEKKVENSTLSSHVMILESQIKASVSRIKSQDNILDFDDGLKPSIKNSLRDSLKNNKTAEGENGGIKTIHPEEVIKVCKLPKYCGTYYDLYNGRFGNECVSISIKEIIKDSEEAKEDRLRREAQLVCQLDHPRLTKLLGQSGDCPVSYIIYESSYIPNALNYLKYKCSEVDDVLMSRWCVQLACALEHIHSKRIILRNMSLENVLVVNEGNSVKLTNFDCAVRLDDGHNCYVDYAEPTKAMEKLAPEVWMDQQWFEATDVWSFALSAIKLFCRGAKLFPFKTERDVKSLMATHESLADVIRCYSTIDSPVVKHTIRQCLLRDHHSRPSIQQLTHFSAYQAEVFTDCTRMKELMVDTLIEHVIENKMPVKSITTLNNFLYFLVNCSSSIKCYRMSNGYERLHSIKLGLSRRNTLKRFFQGRKNPSNDGGIDDCITPSQKLLSICGSGDSLFVLDGENCGVWKVAAAKRKVLKLIKVPEDAVSIQCSSNNQALVVFCRHPSTNGYSAIELDLDGVYIRSLLRDLSWAPLCQGVCIDRLHTLVLYGQKQMENPSLELRVFDTDGTPSSGYESRVFHNISDICIHRASNTILLADLSKNRILLLDSHLQSKPMLLFGIEQGINCPSALHIASDGSLYVGLVSGNVSCFHYRNLESPPIATPV